MFYVKCWLVIQLIFYLRKRREEELSRWEGEPPYIEIGPRGPHYKPHLFSEKGLFLLFRERFRFST